MSLRGQDSMSDFFNAALAAVPATAAAAGASFFEVPVGDYAIATFLSLIGIVARHSLEASKPGASFNFRTFAIDLLTAPMLGIVAYIGCVYFGIAPLIAPGIVIMLAFLGPEAVRTLATAVIDGAAGRLRSGGKE